MIEKRFGIEIEVPAWYGKTSADRARYTSDVRAELARILKSQTGRALADALQFHGKTVTLMPYAYDDCNAQTYVPPGSRDVFVLFTPSQLRRAQCAEGGRNAALPHEILFHELVHALRRVSGRNYWQPLKERLRGYKDPEEFLAILATNIFISDATNGYKSGLRMDSFGHSLIDPELADSLGFFSLGTRAYGLVATFCNENRGFTGLLAGVRARFNPVAAYYKNPRKAFELSAQGDSDWVFQNLVPMKYYQAPGGTWKRVSDDPVVRAATPGSVE